MEEHYSIEFCLGFGEAMFYLGYLFLFALSWFLTGILRRYALVTNLLDIPNHRSSHNIPTPRGGGLAFVLCFLIATAFLSFQMRIKEGLAVALLGAGLMSAAVGFIDDQKGIPAGWRLLSHFIIAVFALYCIGGMPAILLGNWVLSPGLIANILAVLYLVWLLNLYNFMDGIDGIAAVETLTLCFSGALLYYLCDNINDALLPISLAMTVAGFLLWNFPPAKIFMGDVGSGFLGLVLGILSIQAASVQANFFWSWLILLGVFIVDATVTLLRRGLRREVLFEAHRSHAYQHASRYYGKHRPVTLGVVAINLLWLLPMAIAVGLGIIKGSLGLVISYLPLLILALRFKAGEKESF